jgi:malate/lactate dehydrogenase
MKIAIVGCGNVGANLVHHVVGIDGIHTCTLHDVEHGFADAAILDLAGYRPEMARRLSVGRPEDLSASDLILLAVAYKPPPNAAAPDLLASAAGLIDQVLGGVTPKRSAILINLLSPVESMSAYAARTTGLPPNQVLGFGGDLDLNRLRYTLPETGVDRRAVHVIGEHGSRIIPVYPGETDYLQIRDRVRQFSAD